MVASTVLQAARAVTVTGWRGKEVEVDPHPRCQHCGKRVGEYVGYPWSIRCQACGKQATSD